MLTGWTVAAALLIPFAKPPASALPAPAQLGDELEVATPESVGLEGAPFASLEQSLIDERFPNTTSVLVLKDGKLVFERYFRGGGPDTLNDTRSVTKSVTALAVGAALADGVLPSVDDRAFAHLADLAPFRHNGALKQEISIADLLTMSSALECDDWEDASAGNEENMYPLRYWARWAVDIPVKTDYQRDSSGRGPFSYCTAGVILLGQILQRATREPVDLFVERRLLAPLEITRVEWPRSASGEVGTGGGLRMRSRDLAKLGLLIAANGRWGEHEVIPAHWISAMRVVRRQVDDEQSYGYLLWHRAYRSPCGPIDGWYMSGNGGNVVVYAPEVGLVAVVTRRHYNQRGMHLQTALLLEEHVFAAIPCATLER